MRSRFIKITILAAAFSFTWGAWFGLYHYEKSHKAKRHGPVVRLLVQKNFLPADVVQMLERQVHVNLQVTEASTDIGLVRKLLTNPAQYDVVELPSFALQSVLMTHSLASLNADEIPALKQVSIDFQHLNFDPDGKYLAPIAWGVTGFVYDPEQTNWPSNSLKKLFGFSSKNVGSSKNPATYSPLTKIALLDSPIEFLNILEKIQPTVKSLAATDDTAKLTKIIQQIKNVGVTFTSHPADQLADGELNVAQMTNGRAAAFLNQHRKFQFVLPKEKGVLWIRFLAISRQAADRELASEVINALLAPTIDRKLVEENHSSTVLTSLDQSTLPEMQKARYVRSLPIFRYELYVDNNAIAPTWVTLYHQLVPPSASTQP